MAGQKIASLEEIERENRWSQRDVMMQPKEKDDAGIFLVSHSLVAIHRLIVMG